MASALARQLRTIQQADQTLGGVSAPVGKKASFLFDPKEAADYDADSIYALGMAGLTELQQLDQVFLKYQPILFSSQALDMDRALLTADENKDLDGHLTTFLRILSPYFLNKSCHKVLEWLIRKYRINDLNVEAVLECILPYHETPAFVRMVQILYFKEDDKWGFLFDVKKNAKSVNRTFFALRCLADRTILDFLYRSVIWHAENASLTKKRNAHILPFFTYLCMEYIQSLPKVELPVVTHLLPMLTTMMKAKKMPDLQLAAYMILAMLADRFPFSETGLGEILLIAAKNCAETALSEFLLLLATLIVKGHIKTVPGEVFAEITQISTIEASVKKAATAHNIQLLLSQFKSTPNLCESLKALLDSFS